MNGSGLYVRQYQSVGNCVAWDHSPNPIVCSGAPVGAAIRVVTHECPRRFHRFSR